MFVEKLISDNHSCWIFCWAISTISLSRCKFTYWIEMKLKFTLNFIWNTCWKFTSCLLLVLTKFACYSLQKFLVEKKSLVTHCRTCPLEKSLATRRKIRSLRAAEVAHCKICSLLVMEVARCKKSLITRCKIWSLLVAKVACCKNYLSLVMKKPLITNFYLKPIEIDEFYLFILYFQFT